MAFPTDAARIVTALLLTATAAPAALAQLPAPPGRPLVVLTETGEERDGLPVLVEAPNAAAVEADLALGASGELVQVYGWVQQRLADERGGPVEPAYLLLSSNQGGFPRYGFFLGDEDKRHAAYVDIHRDSPITGRFGSVDQIFPHELAHILRRQLVGPLVEGYTNQIHALGVRTDRLVAFNEGFAESLQAVAIDHPEAHPATGALRDETELFETVEQRLRAYRDELTARLAIAPPMRVGFVAWYANGEDVLRYTAVRDNAFARRTEIPDHLLREDPYRAYLLESVLHGEPDGPPETLARMVSVEGVVAALFYHWAQEPALRDSIRDEAFYARFGTRADNVSPLQNVYLKLFDSFLEHRPWDTLQAIRGYRLSFPDEAPIVDALVQEIFLGAADPDAPELWLANDSFHTGLTLFDQYRGMPRVHTFDLNAASLVDLVAIPGVDAELARAIETAAPFASVERLGDVDGVTDEIVARVASMAEAMRQLQESDEAEELTLSITTLLMPGIWRAVGALVLAAALAAALYAAVRRRSPAPEIRTWRLMVNGVIAALLGCIAGWLAGPVAAVGAVALLAGLPAATTELARRREAVPAAAVLLAWACAGLAAAFVTTPW